MKKETELVAISVCYESISYSLEAIAGQPTESSEPCGSQQMFDRGSLWNCKVGNLCENDVLLLENIASANQLSVNDP